jgi:hypothetical protein
MMADMHPAVLLIIQVGAIATALTALFVAVEKLWSPLKRMLERVLTEPVIQKLEEHEQYVRYHLGPNGVAQPLHSRIGDLEETVEKLTAIDIRRKYQ